MQYWTLIYQRLKPVLQEVQDKIYLRIWSSQDFCCSLTGLCNSLHSVARSGVSRSLLWPLYENRENWRINSYIDPNVGKTRHIKTGLLKKDRAGETLSPIRSGFPSIPWTHLSKVPKLFGRITGDNFLCLFKTKASWGKKLCSYFRFSLQQRQRPALQNKGIGVLRMAFRDVRETGP